MIFGSSALVLLLCRKLSVGSNIGKEKHCKKVKTKAAVIVTECTGCCHNRLFAQSSLVSLGVLLWAVHTR